MKYRLLVFKLFLAVLVMAPLQVFAEKADEPHSHGEKEATTDHHHEHVTESDDSNAVDGEHSNHDTSDHGDHHLTGDEDGVKQGNDDTADHGDEGHGHDSSTGHGSDVGHDHDNVQGYEETGANLPLLGTFAAINGGFILFGALRKLNQKRQGGAS